MIEKWQEKIKWNDAMAFLEKYFPGKQFGDRTSQIAEMCRIVERLGISNKETICKIVYSQCEELLPLDDQSTGKRKIIGKKYISDATASRTGICKECLEYAGRIFKIPEEADQMPELPRHKNCKCYYEDIYEPEDNKAFQKEFQQMEIQFRNSKGQIRQIAISFTEQASDVILKMRNASSFDILQTVRNTFRPTINNFAYRMNDGIEIIKETVYAIDFFLGFLAQATPIEGLQKKIFALQEWAKNVRKTYEDIKDIHYERLDLLVQQIHYLPKNPNEARSMSAQKAGWKKATDNENWYHRNNEGKSNVKYYNTKTGQEVVYDSDRDDAKIVTSLDNIGTYNHFPPNEAVKHALFDVIPYWLWGNADDDDTPLGNRLLGN